MGDSKYRCHVGGLAVSIDNVALERMFSEYGQVIADVITDHETGRSKGFGFVAFSDEKSLRDAIEGMNGKEVDGSSITVNEVQSHGSGGDGGGNYSGGYNDGYSGVGVGGGYTGGDVGGGYRGGGVGGRN